MILRRKPDAGGQGRGRDRRDDLGGASQRPKPYPLRTASDVIAVLDRVDAPNVGFLCDLFHLANNGDDIDAALTAYADRIAHVQIADHPDAASLAAAP
jgi:hydroxypyruvate isomerase